MNRNGINCKLALACFSLLIFFILYACGSTQVASNQSAQTSASKTLVVLPIEVSNDHKPGRPKDTLCACIAKDIEAGFLPHLQRAGFQVLNLQPPMPLSDFQLAAWADSLHVDYFLSGRATVSLVGSSRFMHRMQIQVTHTQDRRVLASASLDAVSMDVQKAVTKVGKALEKELQ
jgi:hypothetical protein